LQAVMTEMVSLGHKRLVCLSAPPKKRWSVVARYFQLFKNKFCYGRLWRGPTPCPSQTIYYSPFLGSMLTMRVFYTENSYSLLLFNSGRGEGVRQEPSLPGYGPLSSVAWADFFYKVQVGLPRAYGISWMLLETRVTTMQGLWSWNN